MKTRFDEREKWVDAFGHVRFLCDLETGHLINILTMFANKPNILMNLLIKDIEENSMSTWSPKLNKEEYLKESIYNVTTMSNDELVDYAMNSPLADSILYELESRGVNICKLVQNIEDLKNINKGEV